MLSRAGGVARPRVGRHVRSRRGFRGCLAALDLDGDDRPLFEQGAELPPRFRDQVVQGCEGQPACLPAHSDVTLTCILAAV